MNSINKCIGVDQVLKTDSSSLVEGVANAMKVFHINLSRFRSVPQGCSSQKIVKFHWVKV